MFSSIYKILLLLAMNFLCMVPFAQQQGSTNATGIVLGRAPLREKIFAHTDKDFYVAGEILWFKLYDVSADSLKPLHLSNIAYVEILNANQKPVLRATVNIQNGSGNGSFYLVSSLTSGNYIFRAYTNWMKNFGAEGFFQKQVTIINTLTQLPPPAANDSGNYEIGFFPEGGDLVANMESKVGFKVSDNYGNGINCSGRIIDENNQGIVSFSALRFGIGSFYFTPLANHRYKALINLGGRPIEKALPVVSDKGYVMHVFPGDGSQVKVTVKSAINNENVYLLSYNDGHVNAALMQATGNGIATFTLPKSSLPEGISRLTVFNRNKQPVCERIIFLKPALPHLNITTDKEAYETRSEVQIHVAAGDSANLSMSVYLLDSLQGEDDGNIQHCLWLTSELHGRVESPQYYFNNTGGEVDSALDNLLLTQGWSRFRPGAAENSPPLFRFAPEREGHIVQGVVTDKNTGLPAANVRVFLSVPGRHFRFATAVSNDSGKVVFDIKDYYGAGEMVVQTAREDSMYRVNIADPFSGESSTWPAARLDFSESKLRQLSQHNIAMQVQNAYLINQLNRFSSPALDTNAFYGRPDAVYYLDNYVRFTTMEEVLREYVAGVDVRLRQGNYSIITVDNRNHAVFDTNPLVLVDGVPIFDMNKLMAYDPLKIKRADVLTRKYHLNSLTANGILSYATYGGDLDGFQFDPGMIELSYEGLQLEREFYSPQYATPEAKRSRMPDYRNVLYWSPEIKGNGQPFFYTSDLKGQYLVVLQGLGAKGKPVYGTTSFEVK